jgi:hypothetical protein
MGRGWRAGLGRDRAVCQKAVIDDPDIFRAAKLLIDQHGADAPIRAAQRCDELADLGDLDFIPLYLLRRIWE